MIDYFFFYLEASIVCILILVILLIHDRRHSTRQEKQIWFVRALISDILYFLSDVGWAAIIGGRIPQHRFPVVLFNFLNYVLLSLMAYNWFRYMAAALNLARRNDPKVRIMSLIPMLASILAIIIAYVISPGFWVDERGELSFWYYPMMVAAPILYLISAFSIAMRKAHQTKVREEREIIRLIGLYPLSVIVFGLIQTFVLNAPLFCFGITIMMMYFYIQNMQTLVSVDSLTRLNNRGQIDRYMDQVKFSEGKKTYAIMLDINNFKKINDTYGHAEGDRALILVSSVLKESVPGSGYSVFLGRYGGDEFSIFLQDVVKDGLLEDLPEKVLARVRERLQIRQQKDNLPYPLEITAGYDELQGREDDLGSCLARADQKLYLEKRRAGTGR
ncbi:MAG: GGDEF domain-containing protein [Clostridia bacterium]|nr:GGDEF domain-containing protein [Clostridia bacterium]